ncbi:hypothetical protein ACF05T_02345 [Streptomyces lateritius]|uniref:Metalloprotease n=1 Tax=Streptomyces lateritius TaxID=67313 RepID=A0ABW6Y558_9ACTN
MAQETSSAVEVVNAFWQEHWSDHFTGSYKPPKVFDASGFYDVESSRLPDCGGDVVGDEPWEKYNAIYCPGDDFVAWSIDYMDMGYILAGDSWPYLIVAHEWGHAVQNRLNVGLRAVAGELQADCFAGATLQGAIKDGTLKWEEGDTDEIISSLQKMGDITPWTNPEDHGDISERISHFDKGVQGGVDSCLAR